MKSSVAYSPLAMLCIFSMTTGVAWCDSKDASTASKDILPDVIVETVKATPLTLTSDLPARTVASRIAEIRPQVSGIVLSRDFTEGSEVKAGQPLYHIDPATFRASVDNARAALNQAKAKSQLAQTTLSRYRALSGKDYISRQDLDQAQATAQQSRAAIDAASAALRSAEIDLSHSTVTSPLSGRIGLSSVTEGALVQNGQSTALATVQQLDPMFVDITQPGEAWLRLQSALASGQIKQENGKVPVHVLMQDGTPYPLSGTLAFSDVTVDQTTGAITLRAIIPNPNHQLLPGMFVRARLEEGVAPEALLVAQQAVTRTPRGDAMTLIVDKQNRVQPRAITVTGASGGLWQVTEGLQAGERVIVSGSQRIKPGEVVTPHERATRSGSSSQE
ncbi:efflux RND transporter periplasmic adaptor subunit [Escherichia coli]|uniref:efflux RND transporter periplasmic adaptor subunit n=1 Tax=Escherichia coli TaxID=562 RepID=UPI000F90D5E6|nr:efflux RND transporter periplasmic adaptor subunit [Escherichia coli]EED0306188.1 efflux RND transporter periplasmic adaptor subunit [Escherichia coli]EEX5925956.1 efflux RND transporter periplasmic adaptor subunit [Escherichia coli]EGK3843684.1 efflux RND transporter periplasmic adaptor subunit [Escherichia coli]EHK6131226.1 efflux RND transporter periplasmic adaptor subunit [Escherichia coli]EHM4467153.1 efflux RND transporter periplasmic adaptor subunit [Escherichia coli]